jgi:hypothetical protein
LFLALLLALFSPTRVQAQACVNTTSGTSCGLASFYYGEILPTAGCGTFLSEANYGPGRYFRMPVLQGGCYTVSTCGASTNLQVAAYQPGNNTTPFAYNDDNGPDCNTQQASVVMVPNFTDYANVDVRESNCLLGGTASITVKVRQNNNLTFTSSSSDMCQGQVRALTATPATVTASPQPGSGDVGTFSGTGIVGTNFTGPTPAGNMGTYTQTYAFGYCSTTQSINVFRSPTTAAAGANQNICTSSTSISANVPTYGTGAWSVVTGSATVTSPGSASTTVTGIAPGTSVTLRWTISNGPCTASTSDIIITRLNAPTPSSAGPDQNICSTSATMAGNVPSVGTGQWTLLGGSGTIVTATNAATTVNNIGVGTNTFVWTISNGICPVSTDTVVLTRSLAPTVAQAGPDQTTCDSTVTLSGNAASIGTGTWAVVGGGASIANPSSPNSGLSGLPVGTTVLTWSISNGSCAPSVDTVRIIRNGAPVAPSITGTTSVCPGASTVLTASSAAASPNYVWWNQPVGGSSLSATALYNTPPLSSNTTFYVNVTDGLTGCTSARTAVTVSVNPLPTPNLGPDTARCSGDTLCLDPGVYSAYLWSNGAGGQVNCVTASGSVWVLVTDNNGCQAFDTVQISTNPSPVINLGPDQTFCPAGSTTIGIPSSAGSTYLWSTGATTSQITVTTFGTFTLTCTNAQGCSGSDAIATTAAPTPAAGFVHDTSNCPNIVFFNMSTNASTYAWDFGDGGTSTQQNAQHNYQSSGGGTYNVTLIAQGTCGQDTIVLPVLISCLVGTVDPHLVALTVYPNPSNGNFNVHLSGLQEDAVLRIFDIGGKQVLQRAIIGQRGTFEDSLQLNAAPGMYFLQLQIGTQTVTRRITLE